ncbi:MAG: GNAT family N-acetyltransferase [Lewinellaceae bacterium]|nr:GNAT family N-acetyltransferase [Lewinellaceae bacterium]
MWIRKVNISDLETLRAFAERTFRDAWQQHEYNDPEDFETYCREKFTPQAMRAEFDHPDAEFYLGFIDREPVAYLKFNLHTTPPHDWDGSPAMQLERIYVSGQFQGRRIGEELLQLSEQRARDTGAHWIWLSVWQKSPRSIAFYEKNGFAIFGVEIFWLGADPQSDWLMRKAIQP